MFLITWFEPAGPLRGKQDAGQPLGTKLVWKFAVSRRTGGTIRKDRMGKGARRASVGDVFTAEDQMVWVEDGGNLRCLSFRSSQNYTNDLPWELWALCSGLDCSGKRAWKSQQAVQGWHIKAPRSDPTLIPWPHWITPGCLVLSGDPFPLSGGGAGRSLPLSRSEGLWFTATTDRKIPLFTVTGSVQTLMQSSPFSLWCLAARVQSRSYWCSSSWHKQGPNTVCTVS